MTKAILRSEYRPSAFLVETVNLCIQLAADRTIVSTTLQIKRNKDCMAYEDINKDLVVLNGDPSLELLSFSLDGQEMDFDKLVFQGSDLSLELPSDQDMFVLNYSNAIMPSRNTALEGLYLSNDIYCSDCEPEGFRKITYYLDRPDNMAVYTVKIIAPKTHPVLLSNGHLIEQGEVDMDHHYALWHDPHPKPSYLFAVVAGDLAYIEDQHVRPNNKPVTLRIYASEKNLKQCHFAMEALKKSMVWDEERFGLVMDLDVYNIVAIDDYNAGAMENKGLNVFNTKFVLADPETATDEDFYNVESVIAHEYFHNWTGNRVTCRDWFQLSLKEGLTVFRDQEFSASLHHEGLQRIKDVMRLRLHQFPEDASDFAHPVRPDSYVEMRNFYTTTVYEKGAEVVRLYQSLLGKEGFRKGMDLYFQRHDGSAVTCDDFLAAMRDANQAPLLNFERWYSQSGTPVVKVTSKYDVENQCYHMIFEQILADTSVQKNKQPQLIPMKLALISETGEILLEDMLLLDQWKIEKIYNNIDQLPIPSLLRNFSAPVLVSFDYEKHHLITLIKYETDDFNRFDAMQRLGEILVKTQLSSAEETSLGEEEMALFDYLFKQALNDPHYYAELLMLTPASTIAANMPISQPRAVYEARKKVMTAIASFFEEPLFNLYQNSQDDTVASRALKNTILCYLAHLPTYNQLIASHYNLSQNMTDRLAALQSAVWYEHPCAKEALKDFYQRYESFPLVIDKWFSLQASNPNVALKDLNDLLNHPSFVWKTPNRVRALLGALGMNEPALMQAPDQYYGWLLEQIIFLDKINPQGAARLITPLLRFNKLDTSIQTMLQNLLHKAMKENTFSKNVAEKISKTLQSPD